MCFLVKCLNPEIAEQLEMVKTVSTAEQFRQEIAPVYLCRVREDVLKELPDLIEKGEWCELGESEMAAYIEALSSGNFMAIRQVSWNVGDINESSKARRLLEICDDARDQERMVLYQKSIS